MVYWPRAPYYFAYRINDRDCERRQIPEEFAQLQKLMKQQNVRNVIEIGFYQGGTALGFDEVITDGKIISVDVGPDAQDYAGCVAGSFKNEFVFINGDSRFEATREHVQDALGEELADMLFVDGAHDTPTVTRDVNMYMKFVRQGGLIVMQDIKMPSVATVYDAICEKLKHVEIITPHPIQEENTCGIGVIWKESDVTQSSAIPQ